MILSNRQWRDSAIIRGREFEGEWMQSIHFYTMVYIPVYHIGILYDTYNEYRLLLNFTIFLWGIHMIETAYTWNLKEHIMLDYRNSA